MLRFRRQNAQIRARAACVFNLEAKSRWFMNSSFEIRIIHGLQITIQELQLFLFITGVEDSASKWYNTAFWIEAETRLLHWIN